MREPFPLSGWLVIGFLIAVAAFLLLGPNSQATSSSFTLTEIDPTGEGHAGWWQYQVVADSAPGGFNHWQDSPWQWRHYDQTDVVEKNINCDDIRPLYPADPASPDTDVSADGGTVTVNIYQEIDTVWVCFALECDDGTYSYALMKNLQTEKTVNNGACGELRNRINPPEQPAIDPPGFDDDQSNPPSNTPDLIDDQNSGGIGQGAPESDPQAEGGAPESDPQAETDQSSNNEEAKQNTDDNQQPNPPTDQPSTNPVDQTPSK